MSNDDDTLASTGTIEIENNVVRSERSLLAPIKDVGVKLLTSFGVLGLVLGICTGIGTASFLGQFLYSKQIASEAASKEAASTSKESLQRVTLLTEQFEAKSKSIDGIEKAVSTASTEASAAKENAQSAMSEAKNSANASKLSADSAKQALEKLVQTQTEVSTLLADIPANKLLNEAIERSRAAETASIDSANSAKDAKSQVDRIVGEVKRVGLASEYLVTSVESFRSSDAKRYIAVAESIKQLDREFSSSENLMPTITKEARNVILAKLNIRAAKVTPDEDTKNALLAEASALVSDVDSNKSLPLSKRVEALIIKSRAHIATAESPSFESKLISFKRENKSLLTPIETEQIDAEIVSGRLKRYSGIHGQAIDATSSLVRGQAVLVSAEAKSTPNGTANDPTSDSMITFFRNMNSYYVKREVQSAELAINQSKLALVLEGNYAAPETKKRLRDYASSKVADAIDLFAKNRQLCIDVDLTLSDELLRMCRLASSPVQSSKWTDVLGVLATKYKFSKPIPATDASDSITQWLEALLLHVRSTSGKDPSECICTVAATCIGMGRYDLAGTTIEKAVTWYPMDPCPHYLKAVNEFASLGIPIESNISFASASKLTRSANDSGARLQRCASPLPRPLRTLLGSFGCTNN